MKYKCPACGKILIREKDKKWIKSYCDEKQRDVHAYKVKVEKCQ